MVQSGQFRDVEFDVLDMSDGFEREECAIVKPLDFEYGAAGAAVDAFDDLEVFEEFTSEVTVIQVVFDAGFKLSGIDHGELLK